MKRTPIETGEVPGTQTRRHGLPMWICAGLAILGTVLVLAALPTAAAQAQQFTGGRLPASYRTWTIETPADSSGNTSEHSIAQLQVPVVASLALADGLDLVLSSSAGTSSLELSGGDAPRLSGNSDVTAQLFYRFASDRLMLQLGGNLPAGGATVSPEELAVARALGHPLLGFHLKQYGQGFDTSFGLAGAFGLGRQASMAVGVGYIARGSYEFVEGDPDFQPGNEISVSLGLDALGAGGPADEESPTTLRIDATYRIFGTDQSDGVEIYEEGNQLEVHALGSAQGTTWGGFALARAVVKSDDAVLRSGGELGKVTQAPGTGVLARLGLDARVRPRLSIGAEFESHLFRGSDAAETNGSTLGGGPALSWHATRDLAMHARALYLTGTIEREGGEAGNPATTGNLDLRGWDVGLTLTWQPRD